MKLRAIVLLLVSISVPAMAAEDPLADVGPLLLSGKSAEARVLIEKIQQAYVAQGNKAGEALSYLLLGMADNGLGKNDEARSELDQSAAKFNALGDPLGMCLSLVALAELERQQEHFDAAIAVYERALVLIREASESEAPASAESMKGLAVVFGMPIEAAGVITANPEMVKPFFLRMFEMMIRDFYGVTLTQAGALEKADEQLTRAADLSTMLFGIFDGPVTLHIGDLRRRQWRFDDARKRYRKALDRIKTMPNLPGSNSSMEVEILGKLAEMDILSGRGDEALAWNDRALKTVHALNPKREPSLLVNRGRLLTRSGHYREAEGVYNEALKIATANADAREQAYVLADFGMLHMWEGAYGTAASQMEKAIEIYQKVNEPYAEAPLWINLAEIYMMLEDRGSTHVALEKARAMAKKSGFKLAESMVDVVTIIDKAGHHEPVSSAAIDAAAAWFTSAEVRELFEDPDASRVWSDAIRANLGGRAIDSAPASTSTTPFIRATALMLRGRFLLERGDYAAARAAMNEALSLNPSRDHRAGLFAIIGATYWKEGNLHDATAYFEQAAQALESVATDVKVEEMLAGYLGSDRRVYYDVLIYTLVQQGRTKEAFEQAERARARAFLQVVGNHRINAERGGDPALVREAEALRAQIAQWEKEGIVGPRAEAVRIRSDLQFARERYKSVMGRIKVSNPEYSALTVVEPLSLDDVRAELPPDTTLISYFVSQLKGVNVWVVDGTMLHHAVLPLDSAALQKIVCWASQFAPARDLRGAERTTSRCNAATAEEAYAALFAPLRDHIHGSRLIIVPHGVLHYVPFAALHDSGAGHYLIDDYTLSYIPSASALRFLRSKETPVEGRALVLGNPNSALPAAGQLPFAQQEAVTVAQHLHATPVLGSEARESLLYNLGGKVDLLHIAAHAIYDPLNPLFSRIALAPGDGQDGNLEVHEILSTLDLSGVNLVVLSACQTAVGERSGGDEIVGLTRALLYAGTPGVVSTLWNIDDASSARLMDEFYRRYAAGEAAADALRNAQLAVAHSERYGDPKYWAAFTLTGNPQGRWSAAPPAP